MSSAVGQTLACADPMRQLMQAGSNLKSKFGSACEIVREKALGDGAMLQPALAVIGWRSADGGEVRDDSSQSGSRDALPAE